MQLRKASLSQKQPVVPLVPAKAACNRFLQLDEQKMFEVLRQDPRMQTFHFFSHFNVLLSLIDEGDFIKRVIADSDKQINVQLIIVYDSHALPCAQNIKHTVLQSERSVREPRCAHG